MDFPKLRHFMAVMEHGHFGRAAEALGLSQQAISASVARLEEELGVPLFERGRFGAAATSFAAALAVHAEAILSEQRLAEAEIAALRGGGRGRIAIGVGLSFARRVLPGAIRRFRSQRPGFTVTCFVDATGPLYARLHAGELDLVVSAPATGLVAPDGILQERLGIERDAILVRAQHPLAHRNDVSHAELARQVWLAWPTPVGGWDRLCAAFAARGVEPPRTMVQLDSISLALAMLHAGNYVASLSFEASRDEIDAGRLCEIPMPDLTDSRVSYIARRRRVTEAPGVAAFMEALRAEAAAELDDKQ